MTDLWKDYDDAVQALRTLASIAGDAAADLEYLAAKCGVAIGSYPDQVNLDCIVKAIRVANAIVDKRNLKTRKI